MIRRLTGHGLEHLHYADRNALDEWLTHKDLQLNLRSWFDGGRSGEPVGLAELRRGAGGFLELAVVKFFRKNPRGSIEILERCRVESPLAFRRHLLTLHQNPVRLSESWFTLQPVAGGDLSTMRPLLEVIGTSGEVPSAVERTLRGVVQGWNETGNVAVSDTALGDLVIAMVGNRIRPAGPIASWARENDVSYDAGEHTFRVPGRAEQHTNPFRLINHWSIARKPVAQVLSGKAHGDLNGQNVQLWTEPLTGEDFTLIDLDRYHSNAPLARDPMHLLLALALSRLESGDVDDVERVQMIDSMISPSTEPLSKITHPFTAICAAVHRGSAMLARSRGVGDAWTMQCHVGLVAAALLHLGRRLRTAYPERDKWWCLEVASRGAEMVTDALLGEHSSHPTGATVTTTPSLPDENTRAPGDEPRDHLRLLILSPRDRMADWAPYAEALHTAAGSLSVIDRPAEQGTSGLVAAVAHADIIVCAEEQGIEYAAIDRLIEMARMRGLIVVGPTAPPQGDEMRVVAGAIPADAGYAGSSLLGDILRSQASPAAVIETLRRRQTSVSRAFSQIGTRAREAANKELEVLEQRVAVEDPRAAGRRIRHPPVVEIGPGVIDARPEDRDLRCSGEPPALPTPELLNRRQETAELLARLSEPGPPVYMTGADGVGLTAIVSEILRRRREDPEVLPIDGFVYLSARDPYRVNLDTVLHHLASTAPGPDVEDLVGTSTDPSVPWRQRLSTVLLGLAGTQVLLVIDDAQALCSRLHQPDSWAGAMSSAMPDQRLADAIRTFSGDRSPVQVLLVGTEIPEELDAADHPLFVASGLDEDKAWNLLRHVDVDSLLDREDVLAHAERLRLKRLTEGLPSNLAMMAACLRTHSTHTLTDLIETVENLNLTGTVATVLLDLAVAGLDRVERNVLIGLAVFGRPVPTAAIDHLVDPYLPGLDSRASLLSLCHRQLAKTDGETFALADHVDATTLTRCIPVGTLDRTRRGAYNMTVLWSRAADYFAAHPPVAATRVSHLLNSFAQIELRMAAADMKAAIGALQAVEKEYLDEWGAGWAVRSLRADPRLETRSDKHMFLHNLSRRAAERLQAGDPAPAVDLLDTAMPLAAEWDRPLTYLQLEIQLGDALLMDGLLTEAGGAFRDAVKRAEADTVEQITASAGLARTQLWTGDFHASISTSTVGLESWVGEQQLTRRVRVSMLLTEAMARAAVGESRAARACLSSAEQACGDDLPFLLAEVHGARAQLMLDAGLLTEALATTQLASTAGSVSGNESLIRQAATSAAEISLSLGRTEAASNFADLAVAYSRPQSAVAPYLLRGICQFMLGDRSWARVTLDTAVRRAEFQSERSGRNWQALDMAGLARTAIAFVDSADRQEHLRVADHWFCAARAVANTEAVATRVFRLLRLMMAGKRPDPMLRRVEESALGPFARTDRLAN